MVWSVYDMRRKMWRVVEWRTVPMLGIARSGKLSSAPMIAVYRMQTLYEPSVWRSVMKQKPIMPGCHAEAGAPLQHVTVTHEIRTGLAAQAAARQRDRRGSWLLGSLGDSMDMGAIGGALDDTQSPALDQPFLLPACYSSDTAYLDCLTPATYGLACER